MTATIVVFAALFVTGGLLYKYFFSPLVLGHILADNAFIITAAIGTTFVIISGGIDLSIGSMIGFVGVVMASLDVAGWHPLASAALMLAFGIMFGAFSASSSISAKSSPSSSRWPACSCCAAPASW